jgi:HAE1 family hydrophobic/amphiphilic exporter-1
VSIVVAVIVMLFLGKLNTALAVILAIPIALSASPILYRLCGFTFNLVSLLALINAIGIVVDDSIVVAENVERYRAMGFSLKESVLKGASEVFSAVVAASLSLLSVLIPVSFMGGFIGEYIRQFALGLAAAVAFSLFEALLFLTVRMAYTRDSRPFDWNDFSQSIGWLPRSFRWGFQSLRKPIPIIVGVAILAILAVRRQFVVMPAMLLYPLALSLLYYLGRVLLTFLQALTTTLHGWTEALLGWVRDAYVRSLAGVIKRSAWVLVGTGVFLVATLAVIASQVSFSFVPQSDNGVMSVSLRLPPGTPIDVTNEVTGRLEKYLFKRPEVTRVQTVIADQSFFGGTRESQRATLTVALAPVVQRKGIYELIPEMKKDIVALIPDYPSAQVQISAAGGFSGSSTLTINVSSSDFDLLQRSDGKILQAIRRNKWVLDATSGLSDTTLENVFTPSPSRLDGTGFNPSDIARTLQIATSGTTAATVQLGGKSYDVKVMVDPTFLSDEQSLLNLPLYSSQVGGSLQVGQLGAFTLTQSPTSMTRFNRIYYVQYAITSRPGAPPFLTIQNQLAAELKAGGVLTGDLSIGSGSSMGLAALSRQLQTQAPLTFLLALFLAYLVMGAQFNSWRYPLYLLLPVPIAVVGALGMVVIRGGGLDIFGLMGMLLLIGLSAKNAILYLDFVVERMGKMPFVDALIEAGRLRFRPIIMTSLTVLVTSFPLIFGKGEGSEFGQGLGVVTLGGIVLSAVLTFFVVPAAFFLFERRRAERNAAKQTEEASQFAAENL